MRNQTYHGEIDIDYVCKQPAVPSDVLIVSFPGGNRRRTMFSGVGYGYIVTISKYNVNSLFLTLDSSYLKSRLTCVNRDFKIERTVKALVDKIAKETESTRIIAIGSSMGGFCSIYYGLKYDWDIIAGAPPYAYIWDDFFNYAAGGCSEDDKQWLNSILPTIIKDAGKRRYDKKFFITWGEGETYWTTKEHASTLFSDLNAAGIQYQYYIANYKHHLSISSVFPAILKNRLDYYLGLTDNNEINLEERNEQQKAHWFVLDKCRELIPIVDACANISPKPKLEKCLFRFDDFNLHCARRDFCYAMQGYFFVPGLEEPIQARNKDSFWEIIPPDSIYNVLTFSFQSKLLRYYNNGGEEIVFEWLQENLCQFLCGKVEFDSKNTKYTYFWHTLQRMIYFIDFHATLCEKDIPFSYYNELRDEVIKNLQIVVSWEYLPINSVGLQYSRVLGLLHAANYFKVDDQCNDTLFHAAVAIANELTDFYCDKNGVCKGSQVHDLHRIYRKLKEIVSFFELSSAPQSPQINALKRKFTVISNAISYFVSPDGVMPGIGDTLYEKLGYFEQIKRSNDNFIKPESNIAVLNDSDNLAYITVNGFQNAYSFMHHCDLLSFTFWYDGKQLVFDTGGGKDALANFLRSPTSHSALFCDDIDYITPDYFDWSCLDDFDEQTDYVLLSMSHMLISGVTQKRKLLWVKPNVIILFDTAESDIEHNYTQNFILDNFNVDAKDKTKVVVSVDSKLSLNITQLPIENEDFELKQYNGTTDVNDVEHIRGSLVSDWTTLRKGLNLAFCKKSTSAKFLTVLEAHSGREQEVSVKNVVYENDVILVEMANGDVLKVRVENQE